MNTKMPYVLLNARFHLKHFKFSNLEIACFWCWVFVNVAIKLSDLISILELSATDHGLTKEDKRSHTHTHIHIIITCSHTIQCEKMKCHSLTYFSTHIHIIKCLNSITVNIH